jgi:HSP20 family molecular chaperone IbpA
MSTKDPLQFPPPLGIDNWWKRLVEEGLKEQLTIPAERAGISGEGERLVSAQWKPEVDVLADQDSLIIQMDLPGVDRESLTVNLESNALTIAGERLLKQEREGESYHLQERRYGRFSRRITLPPNLDLKGTRADFKNGVLSVTIPKLGEIAEPYQVAQEGERVVDENYQAYLQEKPELEQNLAGYIVAYADGRRIAEGRDAQELTEKIPSEYRHRSLFIKDVPASPVRFRRPFFVRPPR